MKIDLPHINLPRFISKKTLAAIGGVILAGGIGWGAYYAYALYQDLRATEAELAARTAEFQDTEARLEQKISEVEKENEELTGTLTDEQKKNLALEREKRRNERQIDTLTKLTTIDPELLKKYSKVYFLSENYIPPELENIDTEFLVNPEKPLQILDDISRFLENLLEAANDAGTSLRVVSAYRSFGTQATIKSAYTVQYGAGTANQFSAEQGYSEHQLGTAVDFGTPAVPGASLAFERTSAFPWLVTNAYKYGFILSYPKVNQYYIYEPWHWRFVGRDLARDLHKDGEYFYELDQRDIDEYLIKIFD